MGKGDLSNAVCGARPATDLDEVSGGGVAVAERVDTQMTKAATIVHLARSGVRREPVRDAAGNIVDHRLVREAAVHPGRRTRRGASDLSDGGALLHRRVDEMPVLSELQKQDLVAVYQNDPDPRERQAAMEALMLCDARFLHQTVRGSVFTRMGGDEEDMLQEAAAGLVVGVTKFDPTRGAKVLTGAKPWINLGVQRHGENFVTGTMHGAKIASDVISSHMPAVHQARARLHARIQDREPTIEEIATEAKLTVAQADWATRCLLNKSQSMNARMRSDDADGAASEFGDLLVDRKADTARDGEIEHLRETLAQAVGMLQSPQHQEVFRRSFNLQIPGWGPSEETMARIEAEGRDMHADGRLAEFGAPGSENEKVLKRSAREPRLDDIAKELGVSVNRVRTLRAEAVAKIADILSDQFGISGLDDLGLAG